MDEQRELTAAECRELLGTDCVGRLAFVTPAGPRIVPVNYAVRGEAIEIRTTAYSEVATYAPGTQVAFEIDHLDGAGRQAWSVVAHGVCRRHDNPAELAVRDRADAPSPWAGGHRTMLLVLPWRELTGRRVGRHWPHPPTSGRGPGPAHPD